MDLIHKLLNILLPPVSFVALIIFLPLYLTFKLLYFIKRSMFSECMADKVVLITGASSGIGEQLAYEYARRRACLILIDIREENLTAVSGMARSLGSPDVIATQADVSKVEDCKRFVDEAVNHFGRLDHLVNNAGIASVSMFKNITNISDFTPVMNINFWGSVYATHFAVPHLKKSKGKIVVIASAMHWFLIPRLCFYSASKAALISFFETLRTEFGSDIGITIVTPGLIKSGMTHGPTVSMAGMNGIIPLETAERCAKAIVKSTCRGDKYLTEPPWVDSGLLWKLLCPDLFDWCKRWVFIKKHRTSMSHAAMNKSQEGIGNLLDSASVNSPELKAD